jgi:hypothetical protein
MVIAESKTLVIIYLTQGQPVRYNLIMVAENNSVTPENRRSHRADHLGFPAVMLLQSLGRTRSQEPRPLSCRLALFGRPVSCQSLA